MFGLFKPTGFRYRGWLPTCTHIVFDLILGTFDFNLIILRSNGPSYTWRRPSFLIPQTKLPLYISPAPLIPSHYCFIPTFLLTSESLYGSENYLYPWQPSRASRPVRSLTAVVIPQSRFVLLHSLHMYDLNRWFRCCMHCPFSDLFIPLRFHIFDFIGKLIFQMFTEFDRFVYRR